MPALVQCTVTTWHSETRGANGSEPERASDLAAEAMAHRHEVAGQLAELSALLLADEEVPAHEDPG